MHPANQRMRKDENPVANASALSIAPTRLRRNGVRYAEYQMVASAPAIGGRGRGDPLVPPPLLNSAHGTEGYLDSGGLCCPG
jgi:hypothetical protein